MSQSPESGDQVRRNPSWREILRELEIQPSKALGQNFLHDRKIVRRIVDIADIDRETHVVEIGPGLGILTSELVGRAGSVTAVELDTRLASRLDDHFGNSLRVVHGDVLAVNFSEVLPETGYVVVANLPYSIATAAIQRFFEAERPPDRMILMVQREVAEIMTARPPDMSILSVAVQFYGRAKVQFRVGSGAFIPRPRVESAVVRIDLYSESPLSRDEHAAFFRLVRAGFAQKRKRLDNSIASALSLDKSTVSHAIQSSGIEPSRRAETLDVPDWLHLYESFRGNLRE